MGGFEEDPLATRGVTLTGGVNSAAPVGPAAVYDMASVASATTRFNKKISETHPTIAGVTEHPGIPGPTIKLVNGAGPESDESHGGSGTNGAR